MGEARGVGHGGGHVHQEGRGDDDAFGNDFVIYHRAALQGVGDVGQLGLAQGGSVGHIGQALAIGRPAGSQGGIVLIAQVDQPVLALGGIQIVQGVYAHLAVVLNAVGAVIIVGRWNNCSYK